MILSVCMMGLCLIASKPCKIDFLEHSGPSRKKTDEIQEIFFPYGNCGRHFIHSYIWLRVESGHSDA